ncbi:hypothetical protein L0657_04160 [Dyadobacter sp. CY345]|nr:hypothetical protein [Dyadobacter sp. CY345]MCF2443142.1 hypothetical protein [Dyadobacter sp. CY345]
MQKHPVYIITLGFCVVLLQRERPMSESKSNKNNHRAGSRQLTADSKKY